MPSYWHLIYWGIFSEFIKPWSNSSCTLHTNLHCKTNDTKIWNTTAYAHGHMTFLLRHENTSVAEKTNNPNQMWEKAEYEAQLLLHCSFTKCNKSVKRASEVIHNCGFSLPTDLTSYHFCDATTDRYGKRSMHTCHHWYRGVKRYSCTSSWPRKQMEKGGEGVVTPHTANLPPRKKPVTHCTD